MFEIRNLQDLKILLDLLEVKYEITEEGARKIIYSDKGGFCITSDSCDLGELFLIAKILEGKGYLKKVEKSEDKLVVEPVSLTFEI